MTLTSLGSGYRALVIGASGSIGQAFCQLLRADPNCAGVRELSRQGSPALDLEVPSSIADAAAAVADEGPYQLILHSAGLLHRPGIAPEKSLSAIEADTLQAVFQVNALGPALVLRHFLPLLDSQGAMAMLSAKVGSIGDNRLGGWYAYRASKAALNMLIRDRRHRTGAQQTQGTSAQPASRYGDFSLVAALSRGDRCAPGRTGCRSDAAGDRQARSAAQRQLSRL